MATKSGQDAAGSVGDVEEALDTLDKTMDRLKTLYEQYFLGIQKQAPAYIHSDVERKLRDLMQLQIRNTGLRYRLNSLQAKFGAYNSYWRRTLRQIENGTYLRNLSKIGRQAARSGADIPEEILAAMPKRMREQVLKDRENALAAAKRHKRVPTNHDELLSLADEEPAAVIHEGSELRRQMRGAHVVQEDEDFDLDSFFKEVEAGDTDDKTPEDQPPVMPPSEPLRAAAVVPPPRQPSPAVRAQTGPAPTQTGVVPRPPIGPVPAGTGAIPRQPGGVPAAPRAATGPAPAINADRVSPSPTGSAAQTGPVPRAATGPVPALSGDGVRSGSFAQTGPLPRSATGPVPLEGTRSGTGPVPAITPSDGVPRAGTGPLPTQTGPVPRSTTGPLPAIPSDGVPQSQTGSPVQTGPMPRLATGPMPAIPANGAPRATTGAVPRPIGAQPSGGVPKAPSQVTRPNPISPGAAANRGDVPVESMSGPFPRAQTTASAAPPIPRPPAMARPAPPVSSTSQPVQRPTAAPRPEPAQKPPPGMTDADVNALYAKYVKAKEAVGEKVGPGGYGKLLNTINSQAPKIMEQYKAKGVDFSVVVKDNQVIIRAKPKP